MDEAQLERQLTDIFFVESGEMLNEASLALLKAEDSGNSGEAINQVFRAVHSIKGGAQSLGFTQLAEVAHLLENFLVPLRQGDCDIDDQAVSLMLEAMDLIEGQLQAYQTGQALPDCNLLFASLSKITARAVGAVGADSLDCNKVSQEEASSSEEGSRLLYLSFCVAESATMPGITAFIYIERLQQLGRLLYSWPDIDSPGMTSSGECFKQTAIIQTKMSQDTVKQEAYSVGDIYDIKVTEISDDILANTTKSTIEEITYFNYLVANLQQQCGSNARNLAYLNKLARQIAAWGTTSRGAVSWFPGGLSAWQRMTDLLVETLALADGGKLNKRTDTIASQTLRLLWEAVYNALCNYSYFYSFSASELFNGDWHSVIDQLEARAINIQLVSINLSNWRVLEAKDLRILVDIKDKLAQKGWDLCLISEGENTRRHLNVLEIAGTFIGGLSFYPSIYSAVIASKSCNEEINGHVS